MAGYEIVVGTYEEFTVCYRAEQLQKDPTILYMKKAFAAHLHTASVRAIASNGKYVATGGTDNRVCLLDVRDGVQEMAFFHHDGTVNAVAFSLDGTYLFTGGHDGTMAKINVACRAVEKTWKRAHNASVQAFSVHPYDQTMLSLGDDMVLNTWDLKGGGLCETVSLHTNHKYGGAVTDVQWSPDGVHFALVGNSVVDVISILTTRSVRTVKCDSKPTAMCWISDNELFVGLESGALLFADIRQETELEKLQIYESRLKALCTLDDYIATASSAGDVSLWHLHEMDFSQICTQQIGCRPTCLTLLNSSKHQLRQASEAETQTHSSNTVGGVGEKLAKQGKRFVGSKRCNVFIEESINEPPMLSTPEEVEKGNEKKRKHILKK